MKRKLGLFLSVFVLAIILSGCGTTAPKNVADNFLQAVKNHDKEALAKSYVYDTFDVLTEIQTSEKSADLKNSAFTDTIDKEFLPKLTEFEYTIDNEKIDGDKATVDVHFKTYQLGSAFTEFYSEFISQAMSLAFSNPSDEQIDALATNLITSKASSLTEKTYEKTVPLTLIKKDGQWVVDDINGENNKDVLNAMSGGLTDAMVNMLKAFNQIK